MRTIALCLAAAAAAAPLAAQSPRLELRAIGMGQPATLHSDAGGAVTEATGTMAGGEFSLRTRSLGVGLRTLAGDLPSGGGSEIAIGEATVQLGPRILAAEGGYARRALTGTFGTTVYSFVRVGAASIIDIGGTGLSARLSGAAYLAGQGVPDTGVKGHVVQTALEYHVHRLPILVMIGYRTEVFTTSTGGLEQSQRLGGLVVGGGVVLAH